MAAKTPAEKILENALAPKRVRGDSGEVEQHSIADQLAAKAAAEAAARAATTPVGLGIRTVKLIPGGAD